MRRRPGLPPLPVLRWRPAPHRLPPRSPPEEPFFKAATVRSVLAYFVVVWSLAVVLIAAAAFGVDEAMRFSAFFSGLVGVVLGFYFGRQGTEQAIKQVETTAAEKGQTAVKAAETSVANDLALAALQAKYDTLEREYMETLELSETPKPTTPRRKKAKSPTRK